MTKEKEKPQTLKSYYVLKSGNDNERIKCFRLLIQDGCLLFFDDQENLRLAIGKGEWKRVTLISE